MTDDVSSDQLYCLVDYHVVIEAALCCPVDWHRAIGLLLYYSVVAFFRTVWAASHRNGQRC